MSCGNRTEAIAGAGKMISSPNYPGKYPGDLDCNILLITEEETKIAIQFYNFSVEPGNFWGGSDWIDIYDGRDTNAEVLKSGLCGYHFEEKNVIATGNAMFIRFQSVKDSTGGYFRFKTITGNDRPCHSGYTQNKYVYPF